MSNRNGTEELSDGDRVFLPKAMIESPEWRSLSGFAMQLARRCDGSNNGRLRLSAREMAELYSCSKASVPRAISELVEKGFVERQGAGMYRLTWSDEESKAALPSTKAEIVSLDGLFHKPVRMHVPCCCGGSLGTLRPLWRGERIALQVVCDGCGMTNFVLRRGEAYNFIRELRSTRPHKPANAARPL